MACEERQLSEDQSISVNSEQDKGETCSPVTCRLNNHHLSGQKLNRKDNSWSNDPFECILLVKCHACNLEFKEIWRTTTWFMVNNNEELRHTCAQMNKLTQNLITVKEAI